MEEKPEQSAASDDKPKPNLCQECNTNASKYKCPGCSLRTCSLACVNSHKQRTTCTGKRLLTNFVPISEFDDNQLVSDYTMLEKRIADSARRRRVTVCGYSQWLPKPLKNLRVAAAKRRTQLFFFAKGMSKREKNNTYYNFRKNSISWTVEWRFHSTDVVLLDHGIHEDSTLFSAIEKHLKPGPWNHRLRQFCDQGLDSLKLFIRKYPKGPKSPFVQLDINSPIRQQLSNTVILEYPVIHIFLPSHSYDFDVIFPKKVEIKEPPPHHDYPSPKGVTFKEEEIEDGVSPDPIVLDLLSPSCKKMVTENQPQQLAPVHLTADANSDDFLNFDGILLEQKDFDGMILEQNDVQKGEYLVVEELEEGEIR
ncbi:hypothetical protein OROMI_000473 [Orobanche minor]